VRDVLIDLGEIPRHTPLPVEPGRPASYRPILGALAVVLVVLLAGAAHRGPPDPPVVIPARLGDALFVGSDGFFVVSAGPELLGWPMQNKIISEYALPGGELLSRTTVAVPGSIFNVMATGRVILVSYQVERAGSEATVALTAGTGTALWRQPSRLFAVSAPDGLVLLYENTPEFGTLSWSGIDLATGAVRWSLTQPPRGFITDAGSFDGFPAYLVTATHTGRIEVHDSRTGSVLAARTVPVPMGRPSDDLPVWPAGNLILIGGSNGTDAYRLPDLEPRWRSTAALTGRWIQPDCGGKICSLSWRGGLNVIDPADGRRLWTDDRWTFAHQVGPYLLATDNTGAQRARSISVVDPATGRVLGAYDRWQVAGAERPDGTVVAIREQFADDIVWYAMLDPKNVGVQVIGAAEGVSGDCQASREALVCRTIDASVGIWRLQ
jgi:outer membrane protein assembly factor BamB